MALIEGFRIQNYRALHDIAMGRIGTDSGLNRAKPLSPLTAVIGKNGAGKSSIFDAFGFLADCMDSDIETACNAKGRGGFEKLVTSGFENQPIKITVYYRESRSDRPITYEISIGKSNTGLPIVLSERLRQRAKNQSRGWPKSFLNLEKGKGTVWIGNDAVEGDELEKKDVEFDPHKLAIVSLAELYTENPRITKFKDFIKAWYLSYFYPDATRQISQAGTQKHLNLHGDNIGNVVQYLERNHPIILKKILDDISKKIPGIGRIKTYKDEITNNLYLLFQDKGFAKPFTQQQMSDGTLKMFCYMLLLQGPDPAPFICIEEPENGLYHKLLETLASEFRTHATGKKGASQVFVTTHQPYFVDALEPDEVWVLEKQESGISTIKRASDYKYVQEMADEGQSLGSLWYSDYLDAR
ncbi:AAA family ATPase [Labilibaculum euxinus]|uniref:AAA family ATPase n=1 Tax=Labilibaculum euxinus TaxID=2686357 RepID=A0A7M4D714_9BACT|nr:AAA family ATPase [Labilibaculum euxinus]MUP38443.1 AAA family ATPase [Labilibaculum euxinus]MVB07648.1 AAA family ATPase [Labilibaculum euxinus]